MIARVATSASLFDDLVSWSNIISALIPLLAVAVGLWVAGTSYQILALLYPRLSIYREAHALGLCTSRVRFLRSGWLLLSDRVRTGTAQVRDELAWLSSLSGDSEFDEDPNSPPVPVPFTFARQLRESGYVSGLARLSAAYEAYASSLRRRWLLRSTVGPFVGQEHQCAKETAELLMRWASFEPIDEPEDPDGLRNRLVPLRPADAPRSVLLVTWPDMTVARAVPAFPALGISFQPYRVVMDGSPAQGLRPEPRDIRVVKRAQELINPLSFDGVLPRWHGPGWRLEIDRITGRQKLHLCVAETTYFAFRATQHPAVQTRAGKDALSARVLTLNLLAIDKDDVVLLTRRSDYMVQAGCYTGTISGNCELVSREGLRADLDSYGLPDLLGAVAREAREELGLELTPESQLSALGIIEINSETELGTHVLVLTARLPGSADEFRITPAAPDPVEGLWEIGDQSMTVDIGTALRSRSSGKRLVDWIRTNLNLTPGGAGSLLLLMVARLELRQQQSSRAKRNNREPKPIPWTTADLVKWLEEPLLDGLPDVADMVSSHPLWR